MTFRLSSYMCENREDVEKKKKRNEMQAYVTKIGKILQYIIIGSHDITTYIKGKV